jgi:hypothetical protein
MKAAMLAILLVTLMPVLTACTQPQPPVAANQGTAQPQSTPINPMEIIELPELKSYTGAAVKEDTAVTWTPASTAAQPASNDEAGRQVQTTIKGEAERLAKVDYGALSLPDFVTVTRSLKLIPVDFTGSEIRLDSTGEVSGEKRWAIYSWQGPEIPQLPDRQVVFRWVYVYALYDLKENKVARLIATVRGEAHE